MGIFLLIVAGLVAWFFISAMNRAKTRMAYADRRQAERELNSLDRAPYLSPTWALNQARLEMFLRGATKLVERDGVPVEFVRDLTTSSEGLRRLMHYIALLERQGSSFTFQQIAGAEYYLHQWLELPVAESVQYKTAEMKRKLG